MTPQEQPDSQAGDEPGNEKTPGGASSYSLTLNTVDYSSIFDTLKDYALKLVANAHSEMSEEQWSQYVDEHTKVYVQAIEAYAERLATERAIELAESVIGHGCTHTDNPECKVENRVKAEQRQRIAALSATLTKEAKQ